MFFPPGNSLIHSRTWRHFIFIVPLFIDIVEIHSLHYHVFLRHREEQRDVAIFAIGQWLYDCFGFILAMTSPFLDGVVFNQFFNTLWHLPALAVFRMSQVPFYSFVYGWVLWHSVYSVPICVYLIHKIWLQKIWGFFSLFWMWPGQVGFLISA